MASIEQWTTWQKDYQSSLHNASIDFVFKLARASLQESGITLDARRASALINEAIKDGYIKENESSFYFQLVAYCLLSGKNQRRLLPYRAKDAMRDYTESAYKHEDLISELKTFEGYLGGTIWFIYVPLLDVVSFYIRNHPLQYKEWYCKWVDGTVDFSYCGLTKNQLFDFFRTMTPFCLYKLLVENKYPQAEDLFDSIQQNKYERFQKICDVSTIDFTNVSEIAGYILNGQSIHLDEGDDAVITKNRTLLDMVGTEQVNTNDILSKLHEHGFVCQTIPIEMTEEESFKLITWAYSVSILLPYLEMFDEEDSREINRQLNNPMFSGFMKLVDFVSFVIRNKIPDGINQHLSDEEKERFLPLRGSENAQGIQEIIPHDNKSTEVNNVIEIDHEPNQSTKLAEGFTQDIKTLASRWMTEPYHRMSDDVLVEIISQKIWPQLMNEVDNLQWAPNKRALATFQKTKNMLAACLLFHAMEKAKIAKMPKQEDVKNDRYEGLYGEEDRAQAGVYTTSMRRAGVTHAEKKYNDTLPVGYMEALEKFIPESDMPGRTTSRTYLKLLNYWVYHTYEKISDKIDTVASAELFKARYEQDLGAQSYLYKNNQKRLRAMLKEWRDALPDLFNVPI